jgi:hypothetical protein
MATIATSRAEIVMMIRSKIEEIGALYDQLSKDDIAKLLEHTDPPPPDAAISAAATTVLTVTTFKHHAKEKPMEYELLGKGRKWLGDQDFDYLYSLVATMHPDYMARAIRRNIVIADENNTDPNTEIAGFIDELMLLKVRKAYAAYKKVRRDAALKATTAPSAA